MNQVETEMTERSIAHGSFTVTRSYPARPARVFKAWADPESKRKWFGSPKADDPSNVFEFRVGGREYNAGSSVTTPIRSMSATRTSSPTSASSIPMR